MQKKLLIALMIPLALATSTNLQAMPKARSLMQAAATYARNNKLKTTGIIIGGAIALDLLQTGARWAYWRIRKDDAKIKAAQDAAEKTLIEKNAKYKRYQDSNDPRDGIIWREAFETHSDLREKYRNLFFNTRQVSLFLRAGNFIVLKIRGY